ncbi:hypothetical protein A2955_01065 [Candidatus Woesebacteria bacterium RIFCSPLOWO2_01_FULL_37_19]|uniref:Uncharacterized protein n=2 Tax=Candidatus Woeseibacteriota TaxID=1752722 RepID=A0A1F8AXS2_9BACT|nr:MAG: hypothetical protein A2771_00680 [Candidatus Woesebacteria bacterium RIFCSPHIGHO2_01_FULL_38_26b]OGM56552.1 MAG: hypothetical protein A2955_01065 [Candidatus Woesebacteria bacterium RIFCSPLOWO2_01_FULL_37_19]
MNTYIVFVLSSIFSYYILNKITHPSSNLNKRLPHIKFKFFQILPWVKFNVRGRIFHIHHWMYFSILLAISLTFGGSLLDATYTKGFLLGGIIQGLSFEDWKKIVQKTK